MASQVTVQQVLQRLPDWGNDFGTFHAYLLQCDGLPKPLEISQKPDRDAPAQGDSFWVETKDHPRNPEWLKGKRVAPPQGSPQQQTMAPRNGSPQHGDRDESIERQSCVRSAVILYQGTSTAAVDVLATSDLFLQWVQQR